MTIYLFKQRLPAEYQEVEYIQSSGTQYINTGCIPNNNTKIKCDIGGWNTGTGQYGTMFGVRLERSASGRGFMLDYDSTNSRVLYMFGGGYNPNVGFSFPSGGKHTIEFGSGGVYEDGTLKFTPSSATFTSPSNMYIFALNDNGTVREFGGFDVYSFKIRDNGILMRDFVPCFRKLDGEIGLYDLVDGGFYTNQGTGTFTKGADITGEMELKNAYIGDGRWRLSTDFTQYTSLAEIQAQGWTGITSVSSTAPNYSYGSNGIVVSNPSSGGKHGGIYVKLPSKITAKNTVIMKYTANVPQVDGGIFMTLCTSDKPDLGNSNQTEITYTQTVRSSAAGQGLTINKNVNGTKTWGLWTDQRNVQGITGIHEAEVTLDLPNSNAKWICTSPSGMAYTSEATISSAGIDCLVGTEYFIIWGVQYSSGVTDYIRSGEISII